jgi:hypothetical protein
MTTISETPFVKTLTSFCRELILTFPELKTPITRAANTTPFQFWRSWHEHLPILRNRDVAELFDTHRGFLLGPVCITPLLWNELSSTTHSIIWKYLRTLILESALEIHFDVIDANAMQLITDILHEEKGPNAGAAAPPPRTAPEPQDTGATEEEDTIHHIFEKSVEHLKPLLEKVQEFLKKNIQTDASGSIPFPEIPERLRKGRIAKLAEEFAKQFNPEEFGIDPALLEGNNVEHILKTLAEQYQKDPTLLLAGAKKVAERIKTKILSGSIHREELLEEAHEFVALFKEHPLFKDAIDKLNEYVGEGGLSSIFGISSSAPSERVRVVRERLRKKLAARKAAKK